MDNPSRLWARIDIAMHMWRRLCITAVLAQNSIDVIPSYAPVRQEDQLLLLVQTWGAAAQHGGKVSEADNLSWANLQGATVTSEQLATARSLTNAVMPDGTTYAGIPALKVTPEPTTAPSQE